MRPSISKMTVSGGLLGNMLVAHELRSGHLFAKDEKRPVMSLEKRLIAGGFPASDAAGLCDFLRKALVIDPDERSSARQLLDHPWIQEVD